MYVSCWIESYLGLVTLQQSSDVLLEYCRVGGSHVLDLDDSVAIDQEGDRQAEHAAVGRSDFRGSHHNWIVDVELLVESADRVGAVVHRDADDLQATVFVFFLHFDKVWCLLAARNAPRCPEVQQNYLASIRRELQLPYINAGQSEIRSGPVFLAARSNAAEAGRIDAGCDGDCGKDNDESPFRSGSQSLTLPSRWDSPCQPSLFRSCRRCRELSHW